MQNKIQHLDVNSLNPAVYNPRTITEKELKKIKDSVKEFGMVEPIIVNDDMTVIGGHQRLKCAQALGWKTVPCIVLTLSKKDEKRLNLKLNRLGGEFDDILLRSLLEEFDQSEIPEIGFDDEELKKIFAVDNLIDTDQEPEIKDEKKTICPECGHQF